MSHIIVSLKTIQPSSSCQPTNFQTLQALFLAVDRGKRKMEVQGDSTKKDAWCALMVCAGCCNSTTHTDTGSSCSAKVIRVSIFFLPKELGGHCPGWPSLSSVSALNRGCLQVHRRQLVGWRLLLSSVDEQGQDCVLYAFCVQMLLKVCVQIILHENV
jgi:hypothetical protein